MHDAGHKLGAVVLSPHSVSGFFTAFRWWRKQKSNAHMSLELVASVPREALEPAMQSQSMDQPSATHSHKHPAEVSTHLTPAPQWLYAAIILALNLHTHPTRYYWFRLVHLSSTWFTTGC